MQKKDKEILRLAIPAIVSNITVPLLSLVDVAIVGHLGKASYIGAIAVGSMIFNTVYWLFGFLRMGTSGMTAQAFGAKDKCEEISLMLRSLLVAFAIGFAFILLQVPLLNSALMFMSPTEEVALSARLYFKICIYGAPAVLGLYALTGWFIGMQNSRTPMIVAILQNVVNIIASLSFVICLKMKVDGVAFGTLTAQYFGFGLSVFLFWKHYRGLLKDLSIGAVFLRERIAKFFLVNRDIFLRTLCLVSVMLFFTTASSWKGEEILAVNTLLLQTYMIFSYFLDGFAYAGEALSGKAYGAQDGKELLLTVKRLFVFGALMTLLFTLAYVLFGKAFLTLLTSQQSVVDMSGDYIYWIYILPLAGVGAFVWDGIFIGITATKGMLMSTFTAAATFFLLYFSCFPLLQNNALWLAFILYLAARGLVQTAYFFVNTIKRINR